MNYNTKSDRRESKRKTKSKKWLKHQYGENWSPIQGSSIKPKINVRIVRKKK